MLATTRPSQKNALYQKVIKQGDAFLNRLQRLAKIINLE